MARSPATATPDAADASAAVGPEPGADPTMSPDPDETDRDRSRRLRAQTAGIAQLAGGLAHEIRNPLSTMRLNLDLLAEEFRDPESDRDRRALRKIERVRKESHRLEGLLEDFLRLVRVDQVDGPPTDLNAVVDDVRDFCEPQSLSQGIVTRCQFAPDLPPVRLHVDMFKQALLNLIRNAQIAMPEGGELILRTRREGGRVVLDVIDTGCGIPEEAQARVFEPFFSTRSRGTGLGLPTTRRIVEAHGGSIGLSSEPGKGTQFSIRLPAGDDPDPDADADAGGPTEAQAGGER